MKKAIVEFLDYLRYERRSSVHTINSYGRDLYAFAEFVQNLDSGLIWETVDSDVIRDWVEMMSDKGNGPSSVNRRLSSLRAFYRYAMSRGVVTVDPSYVVKGLKKPKLLPQYVREAEMERLLSLEIWDDSYESVLSRTVVLVFYTTGIRLSELVGIKDEDVDCLNDQLKVFGKRSKERVVPFGEELRVALKAYKELRDREFPNREAGNFFLNTKGYPVTPYFVRERVKAALSLVTAIKKRSPHVLRHSFATSMLNHKSDLGAVQKLLGHVSVETTEIYTHTTFEQLKRVYSDAHPREKE